MSDMLPGFDEPAPEARVKTAKDLDDERYVKYRRYNGSDIHCYRCVAEYQQATGLRIRNAAWVRQSTDGTPWFMCHQHKYQAYELDWKAGRLKK